MPLPNADRAVIAEVKIRSYLLAGDHLAGGPKSVVFRALGYSAEEWERLHDDLRDQHLPLDAKPSGADEHGIYYAIRGTLTGPNGRSGVIKSVWIIRFGEDFPRFVTAYPG